MRTSVASRARPPSPSASKRKSTRTRRPSPPPPRKPAAGRSTPPASIRVTQSGEVAKPTPAKTPPAPRPTVKPRIHARGHERLDGVIDFVTFAARPMPLASWLDDAPRRLAAIFRANIASIYLLEGDGHELVMRGNVGFTGKALGQVRLNVGEGIVGSVVEILRPVSLDAAPEFQGFRSFPELGEERYPVFAAVPILGKSGALGALVIQRESEPFSDADVELLTALAATISAWVRAADLIDASREKVARKSGGGTRKVTLTGRPLFAGRALGAIAAIKRPPTRGREARSENDVARLKGAFEVTEKAISALVRKAVKEGVDAGFLRTYSDIVSDARLRGEAARLCEQGASIAEALGQVARRVVRAAATDGDGFLEDRARDIEDLCDALVMIADSDPRAQLPQRALLVADQLTVFDVLVSARAKPVGIALSERGMGPRTYALVTLLGIPAIADVGGLFKWAADGDIALLDADHGILILNPTRSEIATVRKERRQVRLNGGDSS